MAQDTVVTHGHEGLIDQLSIAPWNCGVGSDGLAGALAAVVAERHRQDRKWANPETSLETFLANLAEEFGEVAKAVNEKRHRVMGAEDELLVELIQVAAVAIKGWQQIKAGRL